MNDRKMRTVRSFVRRDGRMSPGKKRALENLWVKYGLEIGQGKFDWSRVFASDNPLVMEIGFGMGHVLISNAQNHSEINYVGVEVHRPGIARVMNELERNNISNVKLFAIDIVDVLEKAVHDASLDAVLIYFPDPWPKKKHHKRRLIQMPFVSLIVSKLKIGGRIHLATDWEDYAEQMLEVLGQHPQLVNVAGHGQFAKDSHERPSSKFEQRGQRLGHGIWDLIFIKEES